MKFLVDAQLPLRLTDVLNRAEHEALHASQLPDGNRTTDAVIAAVADTDDRVVITKDVDFRDTHLIRQTPRRLWLIRTGNTTNATLLALVESNLSLIVRSLEEVQFIELSADSLVVHDDRR